jgi:predicted Zn-dependent protease with MMP-like domain
MRGREPTLRRVLLSAAAALAVVLGAITVVVGFSDSFPLRVLQALAVFAAGAVIIGGAVVLALLHFANWSEPESEEEFELIVQRAERLAAAGWDAQASDAEDEGGGVASEDEDEYALSSDEDFRALVRSAIDELPLEFHRALEHVAIVVTDGGRERGAYGMYEGDTIARDYFHDRILIFEDTLTRDFGHDPDLLRAQVTRTVRHELAHHLGWGERGVRGLGL